MSTQWGADEDSAALRKAMTAALDWAGAGEDNAWPVPAPRPYAPRAEPGPLDPLTERRIELAADWQAQERDRLQREADLAADRLAHAGARHARRHAFPGALARGTAVVLILLGTLLVAAGTAVKEWTS